jgi:hypothetical protein
VDSPARASPTADLADPIGLAVGLVAFAAYALACAPFPYFLDSAELAAAAFGLGIAHPPGEPLAALWGKLFSSLPAGSVAFRVGLGQGAAGALAAVVLYRTALRLWSRLGDPTPVQPLLAAACALGFAFAPGVVIVADRPEVYALETALALGAVLAALCALDDEDPRFLLLAALLIGLGLATHPLVGGLSGAGATLAAWPWLRRAPARLISWSVVALLVGALVLVYLPVRASALFAGASGGADTIAWGDPRSLAGLGWLLSARTFASKAAIVHTAAASPLELPFFFMEELEPAFALLAPVGLFFLLRRRDLRLRAGVVLVAGVGSAAAALIGGLDPANPDVRGYLGPALAVVALLSATALVVAAPLARRPWVAPALAGALLLGAASRFPAPSSYPGLRHAAAADLVLGRLLEELPARAALVTAHVESAFITGYQRLVEGRRPDVAWAHAGFLASPGYARRLEAAEPDLAPILRRFDLPAARQLSRPLRVEVDEHLPVDLQAEVMPAGLTWSLGPGGIDPPVSSPLLPSDLLAEAARDRQARGYLAWRAFNDATLACARHLDADTQRSLALLQALVPTDRHAIRLRQRCQKGAR